MSIKEQIGWKPRIGRDLIPYLRPINPPMDSSKLVLDLLEGVERDGRVNKTHTCGDFSLLLFYKNHPAFVASCLFRGNVLQLEQLQGVKGKVDFRVATGMDCVKVMADHILQIATDLSIAKIVMPAPWAVKGVSEEMDDIVAAVNKYYTFASVAGLNLIDQLYIRELG